MAKISRTVARDLEEAVPASVWSLEQEGDTVGTPSFLHHEEQV